MTELFQIVLIKPAGFEFVEGFREVMEALQEAFANLGIDVPICENQILPGRTPVVFGASPQVANQLPEHSIIFNLEQLSPGYPWFDAAHLDILRRHEVWDFSSENVAYLHDSGINPAAVWLPLGYSRCLTRIPSNSVEDVDVLFYGVITERRKRLLESISAIGLKVVSLTNVWGAKRDGWISRAKLVLNLHQEDGGRFEIARVIYLLANSKAVVSECSPTADVPSELRAALICVQHHELVTACLRIIEADTERKELAERGFAAVSSASLNQTRHLARVLDHRLALESIEMPGVGTKHVIVAPPMGINASNSSHGWSKRFRVAMFGQFCSATGLGTTARHTARALLQAGVQVSLHSLDSFCPAGDMTEDLSALAPYFSNETIDPDCPVAIYCMPVADFPKLERQMSTMTKPGTLHAGLVWWETTELNPQWSGALARLDAVVGYSEFIAGVAANTLPLTPVLTGRQPLFLPQGVRSDRASFGLPDDAVVFLASFDPNSDSIRKNPVAVITAFRHAFVNNESNARLVFRLNNANSTAVGRETSRLLIDAAGGDPRIGFVSAPMSYRAVLSLYASADVHVSLHRAEGLGLGMLESMRLGIPVIATAWSGNMSYMDHLSACLVRYRLIGVAGNHLHYRPETLGSDAVWADPIIDDAIAWMRHLYRNPDERQRIGDLGRQRAERYQTDALRLNWLHELERIWSTFDMLPSVSGKFRTEAAPN